MSPAELDLQCSSVDNANEHCRDCSIKYECCLETVVDHDNVRAIALI